MDDYAINLGYLNSKDQNEQLQGLAYFAVFDESDLDEKVINKLIDLAENAPGHISDIAGSIITQAVARREQDAVAEIVLKKLNEGEPEKITWRDLEWAIKLNTPKFKVALEKYLDHCTDSKQISWLVKNLPQAYPDKQQIPLLKTFLAYSDDRIVANAIEGIESLDNPETISLYAQMLSHPSHRVRAVAAGAIARINPEKARKFLFSMLNQPDSPETIKSACHAIRHIKNSDFLELVLPLLKNRDTRDEAAKTVAWVAFQKLARLFEAPVFNGRNDLKSRVAASIIEQLRDQCRRHFHLCDEEDSPEQQGLCQLIIDEKGMIAFKPVISPEKADQIAEENKHKGISFFSRLIYRPKPEEIKLTRSEARYEPYWNMICEARVDFVREKSIPLDLDKNVNEIKVGDQYFKANNGKAFVSVEERCVTRKNNNLFINAVTGEKKDFSDLNDNSFSRISTIEEISQGEFLVVPAKIKASILVRDMIFETMKPLKAIEIIAQSLKIEKLNLCFRPVYVYEYIWEAKNTTVAFEIDGITGKINEGRVLNPEISKDLVSEASLFDIGADAIGLVVPGGEIAAKIARAFIIRNR
jgi:HEAT repeat protein